ncbi:MAG: UDP-N-acetylglucosamine 1-carboxyvinyltransferase [Ruminococcaceae bacterium]|nr:UDP-N-acetylglucosamine 1-carboxyvinyltransferase [Oscillospiraceae bacterium]
MSKIVINSSNPLNGKVEISGAKNSALPIIAACLLTNGRNILENIPDISDIRVMCEIMQSLGCDVKKEGDSLIIDSANSKPNIVPYELTGKIRASFLVSGPLIARFGKAKTALPGGCSIGTRPVDLHLKGFVSLGCHYEIDDGYVDISGNKLTGKVIYLDFPSVGATQNIMMASVLASGKTVIENCASEPEICDLADFLNKCGADINGAGTDKITIYGVDKLSPVRHRIIPDRIEAGTFMTAAVATGGRITLKNVNLTHLSSVTSKLSEIGASFNEFSDELTIYCDRTTKSTDIKTMPFPGFPTDMQSQIAALLCNVKGTSVITETVFENRFMYIPELIRMNADIKVDGRVAVINGNSKLVGAEVSATDLRAGAALVIAGLCAKGRTIINNAEYLKRGYCSFTKKLTDLCADIYIEE